MSVETAAIFDRAADLCEQGWTQGIGAIDGSGRIVAVDDPDAVAWSVDGALNLAVGIVPTAAAFRRYTAARRAVRAVLGSWISDLSAWNDDTRRTQAEVVAALREAATRERGNQ